MKEVTVTVIPSKGRKGYSLKHNQSPGYKGIIGEEFGWYKYRNDAVMRAEELMKCWNEI